MQYQETELLDWYVYNLTFTALTIGTPQTANVAIEADANFILVKLTGFAEIAAALQTHDTRIVPLVTVTIFDTGSGRQLLNGATAWPNIVGTGELPYFLPIRRMWKANSNIRVVLDNVAVAGTVYNLRMSLSGIKDFGTVFEKRQRDDAP